jgi:hypothetical protein
MGQAQEPVFTAEGISGFFPQKDEEKNLVTERNSGEDFFDNFFLNGGFPVT